MPTVIDYGKRAGVNRRYKYPLRLVNSAIQARKVGDLVQPNEVGALATTRNFYADISEFQSYVNSSYPYPIIALRGDTGYRTDNHFAGNWNFCKASSKIEVVIVYVVYIPGQNGAIVSRLKSHLGATCPSKVVFMIDMESGSGFAGPGNHSYDANNLANSLAAYAGSQKRVVAYANHYDFTTNWPSIAPWLKKITASYGSVNPGSWGWQYYGGMNYPTAAGFPRSVAPFGSWVDMNCISTDITSIKTDLGLVSSVDPLMEEIMSYYASKGEFQTDMLRIAELAADQAVDRRLASSAKLTHGFPAWIQAYLFGEGLYNDPKGSASHPKVDLRVLQADLDAIKAKLGI